MKILATACGLMLIAAPSLAMAQSALVLDQREQRITLLNSEMEELTLQRQVQLLRQQVDQGVTGAAPVLVGITTGRDGPLAEFVGQQGVQVAGVGGTIGTGWVVRSIEKRRVELLHRGEGGSRLYQAVIGSAPVRVGGL